MRIVAISDTHNRHEEIVLPDGDVLVHAGDATNQGTFTEVLPFLQWFASQPHKHKLFIAGNHDFLWERMMPDHHSEFIRNEVGDSVTYLEDRAVAIDGVKFYGSPWQPEFCNWAFNLPRGHQLREKWRAIPDDTNVLITHGPPAGILDIAPPNRSVGCFDLRQRVAQLKDLRCHVFGHIHHSSGRTFRNNADYVNACICDERYAASNLPKIIDL